jgi:hypothetical protein
VVGRRRVAIFRFEKTMTDPPREYELVYERNVRGLEDVESVHVDSKKRDRKTAFLDV